MLKPEQQRRLSIQYLPPHHRWRNQHTKLKMAYLGLLGNLPHQSCFPFGAEVKGSTVKTFGV